MKKYSKKELRKIGKEALDSYSPTPEEAARILETARQFKEVLFPEIAKWAETIRRRSLPFYGR